MEPTDRVSNIINCLTSDEDEQHDLWVHYLNGVPPDSLEKHLYKVQLEYSDDIELRKNIWSLIDNPMSNNMSDFLMNNFTDYERSVICFLYLGLDISKIAEIKGISEVRIRQSVVAIRYNTSWSTINGTKNKP